MAVAVAAVGQLELHDVASARALIVQGLTERWGSYVPGFNPDLEDFPNAYKDALVLVAKHGTEVVGTGVLQPVSPNAANILRMSVARAFQRQGVGSLILHHLLYAARERKLHRIDLETTASWTSAVEFYKRHNFRPTHQCNGDHYFTFDLSETP
ncbi:MAG: hypothetical protein CFE43_06580 [Burkholderiales bacterium PBB3]|nr:MAG: hypothetical protein CFE43_06580 [Burkholderiales bacterium PBB3]